MNAEELNNIITNLELNLSAEEAQMLIESYNHHEDQCFVKANKEGLLLYAIEFLKAAKNIEDIEVDPEKKSIPLELDWVEGDYYLHSVEPIDLNRKEEEQYSETFLDKLMPAGCMVILVSVILLIIIGFITVVKWL